MADNWLERRREEYEQRKREWEARKNPFARRRQKNVKPKKT